MKIVATYKVPFDPSLDPVKKGKAIALGMTIGSWTGISVDWKERQEPYAGEFLGFEKLSTGMEASFLIRVGYPVQNFPPRPDELLVSVFGKLSMDGEIKLIDLEIPDPYAMKFSGPRFGIEGIRKKIGVDDRPLLMSIFKCGFGLDPKKYAALFREQAEGGVDIVKDDEIFFDEKGRLERVKYCGEVIHDLFYRENRRVLYAVNLSAPPSALLETALTLAEAGADLFLVNVLAYGWNLLQELASEAGPNAALMAHPALAGAVYPSPRHGYSSQLVFGKLMRIAGADFSLFPSPYGSVSLPRDEALAVSGQLTGASCYKRTFPVPSAGIHPGLVPGLIEDFGRDSVINAGGAVHHHPGGTRAGARAFRDAIEGFCAGKSLNEIAVKSAPLKSALEKWS